VGIVKDILRGLHQLQHRPCQRYAYRRQDHGNPRSQQDARRHAFAHAVHITRPEPLCGDDGEAGGQSLRKSDNQKGNTTRGPHRRQSLHPDRPSHDHGIRHAVKLLEQVADEQRNREKQDLFGWAAPGQVVGHGCRLSRQAGGCRIGRLPVSSGRRPPHTAARQSLEYHRYPLLSSLFYPHRPFPRQRARPPLRFQQKPENLLLAAHAVLSRPPSCCPGLAKAS